MNGWAGDLDELSDSDAIEHLEHDFAGWQCFRGVNRLCYARLLQSSPQVLVRGESWDDLKSMIIREIWRAQGQEDPGAGEELGSSFSRG